MGIVEKPKVSGSFRTSLRRKKQLEQDLEHVTQEMYRRNMELAETNQMLSLLRTIDSLVLESQEPLEVISQQIATAITDNSNFPFVALLSGSHDAEHFRVLGISSSLHVTPIKDVEKSLVELHEPWLKGPDRQLKLNLADITAETIAKHLHLPKATITDLHHKLHIQSVAIIKLISQQKLVGLMVVGFGREMATISEKEQLLLDRLSEAVGIALDNKLLFEENQRVVRQLQKTNEKLKALDETKDEFISMASHQLRTPLTSVKGYMSMVLEGDAGKLNKNQAQLLTQAFTSSQRMVYLIADLLNVSRLRTGKFVIEPVTTNLADVVGGEMSQLYETAKGRHLELKYDKPKDFPLLALDETKIRQVIMNFVDNAIYYTPAGGHINVSLVDKGNSIEFTVTDDGMGIPKADQHHLFGKFYRAGNAKKARPDGTGLGLFMAKKVIIAQGGSIIFKSQEGKGSTFGFAFAKEKLKVKNIKDNAKG